MDKEAQALLLFFLCFGLGALLVVMAQAIFLFGDWHCAFIHCTYVVTGS